MSLVVVLAPIGIGVRHGRGAGHAVCAGAADPARSRVASLPTFSGIYGNLLIGSV